MCVAILRGIFFIGESITTITVGRGQSTLWVSGCADGCSGFNVTLDIILRQRDVREAVLYEMRRVSCIAVCTFPVGREFQYAPTDAAVLM